MPKNIISVVLAVTLLKEIMDINIAFHNFKIKCRRNKTEP